MPTRDGRKRPVSSGSAGDPLGIRYTADRGLFFTRIGYAQGIHSHCSAGVHRHSCLAKEDPDNSASSFGPKTARRRGSLHERSPMRLIRPTLSACCDESQLLLGIPPQLHGDPPIGVLLRQDRHSSVRKQGPAVPGSGHVHVGDIHKSGEDNLISASIIIA